MVHLTSLDLSHTVISSYGLRVVCGLSSLRRLDLTKSVQERWYHLPLPDNISRLARLESLVLDGCPLTQLPNGISHLERLETLQLNDTLLRRLPEGMAALTGLRRLEWSLEQQGMYDRIDYQVLRRLRSLQHLALRDASTGLPFAIIKLTALTELWLDACMLKESAMAGMLRCKQLERLTLLAPQVKVLPEVVTTFTQLSYIEAYSCTKMPPGLSPAVEVHTSLEYVAPPPDDDEWVQVPRGDTSDDSDDEDYVA
jgi:Leucine-rich repeat (LRR) protein